MAKEYPYVTRLNVRFKHLEVIDMTTSISLFSSCAIQSMGD